MNVCHLLVSVAGLVSSCCCCLSCVASSPFDLECKLSHDVDGGVQVERGEVGRSWLINIPRLISRSS